MLKREGDKIKVEYGFEHFRRINFEDMSTSKRKLFQFFYKHNYILNFMDYEDQEQLDVRK